eukprot:jgi/Ulvmu1/10831/UM007_0005.1
MRHPPGKVCRHGVFHRPPYRQLVIPKSGRNSKQGPWNMLFDLRERETVWTDENKARLVKIVAKKALNIPLDELQFRLDLLLAIIPDLEQRVINMHPDDLAMLLSDPEAAATSVLQLRSVLPMVNVSELAAKMPSLLRPDAVASLPQEIAKVEALLDVKPAGQVAEGHAQSAESFAAAVLAQPLLLDSEGVSEALEELLRLMPAGTNVQAMLMRDPDYILRVQRGQKRIGLNPDAFPDASYIDVQVHKMERPH